MPRPRLSDPIVWDGQRASDLRRPRAALLTPVFAGLIGAIGIPASVAAVLTPVLSTLAGFGLQLLFQQQKTPAAPKAADVQANVAEALSSRRRVHGRSLVGSVKVLGHRRGRFIYVLHYICEGPIGGFIGFRLENKPVTLDEDGYVTDARYRSGDRSRVRLLTKLGTMADEPFDEILEAFPELDDAEQPFRHRGCAMVLQIIEEVSALKLQDVFPNGVPTLRCLIDGLPHYDPRSETSVVSDNAALCTLSEAMDVYGLTTADMDRVDFAGWAAFADHCDELVDLKAGGTEKRYRSRGTIMMDAENEERLKPLARCCNADVHFDSQGRLSVRKLVHTTPSITLAHSAGDHLSLQLEGGRRRQKRFNTVKAIYVESAQNWKETEVIWRNQDALDEDGEELTEPLDLKLCPSGTQAQRLSKLFYHDRQPEFVGQARSGPQALELIGEPVCTLDLSPEDSLVFMARTGGFEFDARSQACTFSVQSIAEGADAWDPETEEQDLPEPPPHLPSYLDDVQVEVTANVTLLENSSPVIDFAWEAAFGYTLTDGMSFQLEVSVADLEEWLDANVNQDERTARFGPAADLTFYDWRIRMIRGGRTYDWQVSDAPVEVVVDPGAPAPVTGAAASSGGSGTSTFSWTAPNSDNYRAARLYWHTADDFEAATAVTPLAYGAPSAAATAVLEGLPSGTLYGWIEAINRSGVASPETPTGAFTVV